MTVERFFEDDGKQAPDVRRTAAFSAQRATDASALELSEPEIDGEPPFPLGK